jgi:adenosine deaminase CECR1
MGLEGLAIMAETSIRWRCNTDQTEAQGHADLQRDGVGKTPKANRLQDWYTDYSEFCKWIVDNFSWKLQKYTNFALRHVGLLVHFRDHRTS